MSARAAVAVFGLLVAAVAPHELAAQDDEDIEEVVVVCEGCGVPGVVTADVSIPLWMYQQWDFWWMNLPDLPDFFPPAIPPTDTPPEDPDCDEMMELIGHHARAVAQIQDLLRSLSSSEFGIFDNHRDGGDRYMFSAGSPTWRGLQEGTARQLKEQIELLNGLYDEAEAAGCMDSERN